MKNNFNQYYIVRTDRAGVFFGQIKSKTETSVVMTDVRKLFSWSGAAAVEQFIELTKNSYRGDIIKKLYKDEKNRN